jgi:Domain of unknown function (DUF1707)
MSAQRSSPQTGGSAHRGRPRPEMRVSDAERAEVTERLSRHYSDGRLDQAELNERLDRAMNAKTQSDFDGLFADLPGEEPEEADLPAVAPRPAIGRRHPLHRVLFLAFVVVIAIGVGHAMAQFYFPWLLIGLLVFLWLRFGPGQHRRSG